MLKQFPNWVQSRWISGLFGLGLVGIAGLSLWLGGDVIRAWLQPLGQLSTQLSVQIPGLLRTIQAWGWYGVGGFIGLYVLATLLGLPCTLLTLGGGVLYGPIWGVVYVFAGAWLGATGAFLLGRYVARDWVQRQLAQRSIGQNRALQAVQQAVDTGGAKIVLLTRLSPLFPFSLLSYAYALTNVTLQDYWRGSVGILPATIVYVYSASLVGDLAPGRSAAIDLPPSLRWSQWGLRIAELVATIAVMLYLTRMARQALQLNGAGAVDPDED